MTLQRPEFLLALLALPLLWWLARPPKPRQQLWTAHMQQWQLAMRALRRRPPRGSPLRLLLLAAALVAAALAAAGPSLPASPGPDRLVILLDGSRSMAAARDGVAAFEAARARLREALAAVPAHVEVTLLRCGGDLRRRHGEAARQLSDLGAPSGPLAVDLVELAAATQDARTAVWVCTDGQGQRALPAAGALDVFDVRGDNAAVVALRVEDAWPLPELRVEVDAVVHAADGAEVELVAQGEVEGGEQRVPLAWRDGEVVTARFDLRRAAGGGALALRVELDGDVLAADDARLVRLPPLPAPRIAALADAEAGPFAAVAAAALAAEVQGEVVPPTAGGEVGLLLVDGGVAEVQAGAVRALTFGTRLAGGAEAEPWTPPTGGVEWDRDHPVTRGLDLSELRLERAWRGVLPAGEVLLWTQDAGRREPLAVLVQGDGVASVHFAFRLQDGNLPLLAAFPQLLRRAFVRSYGDAAALVVEGEAPPPGELDLRTGKQAERRPLPGFGEPEQDLARWFVVAGLLALALRAFVR